jgi:hypothetical protein
MGQLDGGVAALVLDDLAEVLGPVGAPGRKVGRQAVGQLAQDHGELVLVLGGRGHSRRDVKDRGAGRPEPARG